MSTCGTTSVPDYRSHVTLLRPALSSSWGRCGCASQHRVFRNTTSFLGWPLFNTLFAATNTVTEFALVTSDTVSRPLPEHSTTQTSHKNPHVCRPHRNGTPSLLSERRNAARNTRTCGPMTRHTPSGIGENTHPHPATLDEGSDAVLRQKERNANSWGTYNSHFSLGASFWIGRSCPKPQESPLLTSQISEISASGAWVW